MWSIKSLCACSRGVETPISHVVLSVSLVLHVVVRLAASLVEMVFFNQISCKTLLSGVVHEGDLSILEVGVTRAGSVAVHGVDVSGIDVSPDVVVSEVAHEMPSP